MPRICAAHLDRLRERPLEAGATTTGVHGTFWNGANSCGAGPMLESGRWAVDCAVSHGRAMGYERRRYRGLCKPSIGASGTWPKNLRPNRPDLTADGAFYPAITAIRLPGCKVASVPRTLPCIAVLGGISRTASSRVGGRRMVAGTRRPGSRRGYEELPGSGMDYLGGRGDTPRGEGRQIPPLSSYDQADVLCAIVRHLRLKPAARHRRRLVPTAWWRCVFASDMRNWESHWCWSMRSRRKSAQFSGGVR